MKLVDLDAMFDAHTEFYPDPARKMKTFTAHDAHNAALRAYAECRNGPGDTEWFVTAALGIATVMTELGLANEEAFYLKESANVGNRKRTRKNQG